MFRFMVITVLMLIIGASPLQAEIGETFHILSHDNELVITDPSEGFNDYRNWVEFPSEDTDYRKVVLYITYRCPDSLHCGEWDYIDAINLRRIGGIDAESRDIEIARMISPYGWRFGSDWEFTWHVDITDFALLLHDSVEVEFKHGGYESPDDRGWLVTLDFEITIGKPAMICLGMDTLWTGRLMYGDTSQPIENFLQAITFTDTHNANIARMRILQTGHGMDSKEICSEFCSKYHEIFFDDSLVDVRQIWRKCGSNPVYPQAGTWIFDRANWCPGSVVYPDIHDFSITPGSSHTVNIDMEPYTNTEDPSANYHISTNLFYYEKPWAVNDVSLEEIIIPSSEHEYSRLNPACADPRIVIKNNGRDELNSVRINYGPEGIDPATYDWIGEIVSQDTATIDLPGSIPYPIQTSTFEVSLESPNGTSDEYPYDNKGTSIITTTPVYDTILVLAFKTNADTSQNAVSVTDGTGETILDYPLGTLLPSTQYCDTLRLEPGCYNLAVIDTMGDGLEFWFNPDGGYGHVRLLDINGKLIEAFGSDFGNNINHWFRTKAGAVPVIPDLQLPLITIFPPRNEGRFELDVFANKPIDISVKITDDTSAVTVFEEDFPALKETSIPIELEDDTPDGIYRISISTADTTIQRRIKVQRQ